MLVLSRKVGEVIRIELAEGVPRSTTVSELLGRGPIEITVTRIAGGSVKLAIRADRRLTILREELYTARASAKHDAT